MTVLQLTTINIGTDDPRGLADFYVRLLGYPVAHDEGDFVIARDPGGGVALSFQLEAEHRRSVWPAGPNDQQMQLHLEIRVDDLEAAVRHAVTCGATVAEFQPQDDVRVCIDPSGHPFCLWLG